MKNIFLALTLLLSGQLFSQQENPVTYKKVFGGYTFTQNGKALKPKAMLDLFQGNEKALAAMKKAKSNYDPAVALGFIGGALIGWPLGTAIGGGDPNWALAGIGAGLVIAGIPLSSAFNKNAIKAVDIYNGTNSRSSAQLHYGLTPNGAGLLLKF